jgi:hypothetical protein
MNGMSNPQQTTTPFDLTLAGSRAYDEDINGYLEWLNVK